MPRLPTAADVAKVNPASGPIIRVDPKAYGVGGAEAMAKAASDLSDIAIARNKETEETEAQDKLNQLSKYRRELTVGNGLSPDDPEYIQGYASLEGEAATAKRQEYEEKLQTKKDELLGNISSERVRRLFGSAAERGVEAGRTTFGEHALKQQKIVEDKVHETAFTETVQNAVAMAGNYEVVSASANAVASKVYARNKARFGEEVAESMAEDARTKLHVAVLEDLKVKDPALAEERLTQLLKDNAAHKEKTGRELINADTVTKLKDDIQKHSRLELSQTAGDDIARRFDLSDAGGLSAAYSYVQKTFKGEDEKAVNAELDRRVALAERTKTLATREASAKIYQHIAGETKGDLASFAKTHPNEFKLLSNDARLLDYYEKLPAELAKRGEDALYAKGSDGKSLSELINDKNALVEMDLSTVKNKLTKPEFEKLRTYQIALQDKNQKIANGEGVEYQQGVAIVGAAAPTKKLQSRNGNQNRTIREMADLEMTTFIKDFTAKNKRPPGREDMAKEAIRLWRTIEADPANTGRMGMPNEGEDSFSGFALESRNMSAAQKAVARVPIADITVDDKRGLIDDARALTGNKDLKLSDKQLEELAAATSLRDVARVRRILNINSTK